MRYPVPPVEPIYKRNSHSFHLIMSICTFGVWALAVWWWRAPMVNRSNEKARRQYRRDLATYEQEKFRWQQAQMPPTQYQRPYPAA